MERSRDEPERSNAATSRNPAVLRWDRPPYNFLKVKQSRDDLRWKKRRWRVLQDLALVLLLLSCLHFYFPLLSWVNLSYIVFESHCVLQYASFLVISSVDKCTACVYCDEMTPALASLRAPSFYLRSQWSGHVLECNYLKLSLMRESFFVLQLSFKLKSILIIGFNVMLKNWSKTQTYSREAASSQISSNSNAVFFFFF